MDKIFWIEPGKLAGSPYPATWELRDLYQQGFRILVPLEVRDDLNEVEAMGYEVHPFDIRDFSPPTLLQMDAFNDLVQDSGEKKILVHCLGGYGRTGTMLAAYLMKHKGYRASDAIEFVRKRRPGAIEVTEQVEILKEYETFLKLASAIL